MKPQSQKIRRHFITLAAVALAVGVGLWLFDYHIAQGKDVPTNALVVDVRTPGEYAGDHYEGAVNIPVSQLGARLQELGARDRNIIVYCRSGNRSRTAKSILERAGFTKVEDGGSFSSMRRRKRAQRSASPDGRAR